MRILVAITKGEVGGAQEHVRILAHGLVERDHEVAFLVRDPSPLSEAGRALGATVLPWVSIVGSYAPRSDWRARRELRDAVASWRPDILHLNSSKAGVVGTGALCPPRGVTVFTCHHAPFGPGRKWSHRVVARPVEQLTLPRMHGIISDGVRDLPALRRIAPRVPVQLIPNAVPIRGEPTSTGPLAPNALWVARLAHPKDPLLALATWERVIERVPEARLVMCGTGPLEAALRAAVARSPARRAVDVVGFVPDIDPLRAQASLFLLATHVEGGLTMATLEAMTEGLVPVVSDAGDAFQLDDTGCGVCVREPGPEAFAAAVVDLLGDPERYDRLRSNALAYARVERTPAHLIDETVDFYRRVLSRADVGTR